MTLKTPETAQHLHAIGIRMVKLYDEVSDALLLPFPADSSLELPGQESAAVISRDITELVPAPGASAFDDLWSLANRAWSEAHEHLASTRWIREDSMWTEAEIDAGSRAAVIASVQGPLVAIRRLGQMWQSAGTGALPTQRDVLREVGQASPSYSRSAVASRDQMRWGAFQQGVDFTRARASI